MPLMGYATEAAQDGLTVCSWHETNTAWLERPVIALCSPSRAAAPVTGLHAMHCNVDINKLTLSACAFAAVQCIEGCS